MSTPTSRTTRFKGASLAIAVAAALPDLARIASGFTVQK